MPPDKTGRAPPHERESRPAGNGTALLETSADDTDEGGGFTKARARPQAGRLQHLDRSDAGDCLGRVLRLLDEIERRLLDPELLALVYHVGIAIEDAEDALVREPSR
jgi:hypothetical protein